MKEYLRSTMNEDFEVGRIDGYRSGYIDGQAFAMNEIIRLTNRIKQLTPIEIPIKTGVSVSDFSSQDCIYYCDTDGNLNFRYLSSDIHEIDEWITHIED